MNSLNKILIVDDDDVSRFLITRVVRSVAQANQIQTAGNGEEALLLLNQGCSSNNCPELILLDINMPIMNGLEFLQELQNSPIVTCALKIAVLTTSNNPLDYLLAHEYPIIAFLEKPLTEDMFKTVLAA
ncbi:response regulator [Adhaeribacter radiodurans]|uniref:Response regulator n=1 Tax=Adhaeribacter radiodurans TaxID=2745197 RepID=A0A7L7LC74_9BACT|nr:response regulator [Adhaeribacter radiodurans]QMU30448.1 response regulator [Adhaeribacter radiodurans]